MDHKLLEELHRIESGEIRSAHIYELVDTYYQCVICKIDEYDDNADEVEEVLFPKELLQPLTERRSGIEEALTKLIDMGYDIDESDGVFNALMLAVAYADEPMTAFLLAHGADPYTWPDMEILPGKFNKNYYLEDIDIHYMDACFARDEDHNAALLHTAQTFVQVSGLRDFGGLCLLVDKDGNVSLEPPKMKY